MIDRAAMRQLDDVLSRSPLALVAFDAQGRISYWSARARDLLGYEASDVLGKRADRAPLVPPGDPAGAVRYGLVPGDGAMRTTVDRNLHADGSIRTFRWSVLSSQDDPEFAVVAICQDVTDAVENQSALAESEARFRALFDSNPDPVVFLDPSGAVVDVNPAIGLYGPHVTRDVVLAKNFRDWLHPNDVPLHEEYLQRSLAGETLSYRTRAISFSGRPLELAITTVPSVRDGKISGVFCIVRDETAQRTAERQIAEQERALSESEARLRSLFEHNPDPVLDVSLDGTMVACNDAAVRVSGLPREMIVGSKYDRYLPAAMRPAVRAAFAEAAAGRPANVAFEIVNAEGRSIEVDGTIIPQYSRERVVGLYAVFQDITDRRVAERRAEMQRRRIRDLYFIATAGGRSDARMHASLEMGTRAFGLAVGAVIETTADPPHVTEMYRGPGSAVPSDETLVAMAVTAARSNAPGSPVLSPRGVAARLDVAGEPFGALVFAGDAKYDFAETDADLLGLISTLVAGAIENERSRSRLRTLAYFDVLTGLPNRLLIAEKLRDAIEIAQSRLSRAALLLLDLDGFKDVNDTLGHARGDLLLRAVAKRLSETVGARGTIARMGSDEFGILLTDVKSSDDARELAERVIAVIGEPFMLDEYEQYISTSIGIAMYPEDGRDDQTLVKNADIAMSRAKDRGRNGYFFYNPTLEAPILMRLSQEKLLRRALDLEEFCVYYQPQIDLRNGRVVSVEALVRWNHPKSGLIEPRHFIPSAEMSGLIVPLGEWVVRTAVGQLRAWQPVLGPMRVAVNLSARQFHDRDLRSRILAALAQEQLAPEFLELEITETVAMSDAPQTAEILRDLAASGIRIAVDDFGTGYSSLAYLRQFELDVLKVDGSFVKGIGRTEGDEALVNTIIGMAHSLDLEVIAEGVETLEQLAFLSAKGCDVVQGFAIAPALPAADLEAFVLRRREAAAASG